MHPGAVDERGVHREVDEVPDAADGAELDELHPVLAAAQRLHGHVIVAKLNSDAAPAVSARYGIRSIPTTLLFRGGMEIGRHSGVMPLPALNQWLATHLGAAP